MRVLAQIQWCETHGTNTSGDPDRCRHMDYGNDCVVLAAEVLAKVEADPSVSESVSEGCPDCDGTGEAVAEWGEEFQSVMEPCPSCSVEPKQTEQNIERAADIIRRSTVRTSDLISIGDGRMGTQEWDDLDPKAQDAWVALARKVIEVAEGKDE